MQQESTVATEPQPLVNDAESFLDAGAGSSFDNDLACQMEGFE
jgi:hypothetical protein